MVGAAPPSIQSVTTKGPQRPLFVWENTSLVDTPAHHRVSESLNAFTLFFHFIETCVHFLTFETTCGYLFSRTDVSDLKSLL